MNVTVKMSNFGCVETALRVVLSMQLVSPRWEQMKFVLHVESEMRMREELDKFHDSPLARKIIALGGNWDVFPKQLTVEFDAQTATLEMQNINLEELKFLEAILSAGDLKHKIWT